VKEIDHLEDLGVDGMIIFKCTFKESVGGSGLDLPG
jgi:hypothetical protein